MARKIQVTIDDETLRLLKALAAPRAGDRSFVIREAVRRMADQEGFERYLDWLEQQPGIGMSVDRALSDEQGGRTVRHARCAAVSEHPGRGERPSLDE